MRSIFYLTGTFLFIITSLFGQDKSTDDRRLIRETLQIFQQGYTERDTSKAAEWGRQIFYDNVEIIGTYSVHFNDLEWFKGAERAIEVTKADWLAWGDMVSDIDNANIDYDGDMAWVSFEAVVTRSPENSRSRPAEVSFGNVFNHFNNLSEKKDGKKNKLKLMEAAYFANLLLFQYEQGEEFVWPIRISGVLQKKDGQWKFRQMHYSHPNRGFPNVRNSNN